jgi:hypothetical protein
MDSQLLAAWQVAKVDAAAVEATVLGNPNAPDKPNPNVHGGVLRHDARGDHARMEAQILNRLRSEEFAVLVGEAWLDVGRHRKNEKDGQRVVKSLLEAFTLSRNARLLEDSHQLSMGQIKKLQNCTDELHKYFMNTIERDALWKILAGHPTNMPDLRNVRATLGWIKQFLSDRLAKYSDDYAQIGLSREVKTSVGPRVAFSVAMSDAMRDIFGRPLDNVVCNLTQVVFENRDVTVVQIKNARKAAERRRGVLGPRKSHPVGP